MNPIHAVYENGVFWPTEPISLPENCEVELTIELPPEVNRSPLQRLAALAEQFATNTELPVDLAAQHDHYLYGNQPAAQPQKARLVRAGDDLLLEAPPGAPPMTTENVKRVLTIDPDY